MQLMLLKTSLVQQQKLRMDVVDVRHWSIIQGLLAVSVQHFNWQLFQLIKLNSVITRPFSMVSLRGSAPLRN